MHPGTPQSVPAPLRVFAVGVRGGSDLQPLPSSTVTLHRSGAEADLSESTHPDAVLIEQRILPWRPADETTHVSSTSSFEYTVGYRVDNQIVPWGLSFSTDRSVIENELEHVQEAIVDFSIDEPVEVLVLERPIFPWYQARPRAIPLQ